MKRRELLKGLAAATCGGVLANTSGGRADETDSGAIASPAAAGTTPTGEAFEDKTDWLQSLLDSGEGLVRFPDGRFQVSRALQITDGTRLICTPKTHLRLADGANCPLIKNREKRPQLTRGVTIEGGLWDGNNLGQQRDQPKDKTFAGAGPGGELMCFTFMENFTLRDVTIKDPESYAVMLTGVDRFTVENVTFDFNMRRPNMDGIHVNGYARHGMIRNLKGSTNDDMVALNSDEGFWACEQADIENIAIEGLYNGARGFTGVRLLSRQAAVRNIVIRNVFGAFSHNAINFTHWGKDPEAEYGRFDGILIDGVFAASSLKQGQIQHGLIWFQEGLRHIGRVTIQNVVRTDEPDALNDVPTIEVPRNVHIASLVIRDVVQRVPGKKKPPLVIHPEAKIWNLKTDGVLTLD